MLMLVADPLCVHVCMCAWECVMYDVCACVCIGMYVFVCVHMHVCVCMCVSTVIAKYIHFQYIPDIANNPAFVLSYYIH